MMNTNDLNKILLLTPEDREKVARLGLEFTTLTANTAEVVPGTCFVAINGSNYDAHEHIGEIIAAGAALVIVERAVPREYSGKTVRVRNTHKALAQLATAFYDFPSRTLKTVGVTGTNGKTTVTHLVSQILESANVPTGLIGTVCNRIGDRTEATVNTTPDALNLQKTLAAMRTAGMAAVAMEVSSIALVQGRTWGTDFSTMVFTNLTEDHLDYHGTMAAYFRAKSLLFTQTGALANQRRTAVINIDDEYGQALVPLAAATSAEIITYGTNNGADVRATEIKVTGRGTQFTLHFAGRAYAANIKLIGRFNVLNALAAFAAAYAEGVAVADIMGALERCAGVTGRFEIIHNNEELIPIVDYAHTPDGLENVLKTINEFATGRIFCVVGCGGDRERNKRHLMGEIAVRLATDVIFTSDNPRTESPNVILHDMTAGLRHNDYTVEVNRTRAITQAIEAAAPGDVVLVAGKGHETYQIIGKTKHHFDDHEQIQSALDQRALLQHEAM